MNGSVYSASASGLSRPDIVSRNNRAFHGIIPAGQFYGAKDFFTCNLAATRAAR
jgi:hypothetical protein